MRSEHEDKARTSAPKMRPEECSQAWHKSVQAVPAGCPECGNFIPVCGSLESQEAQRFFGKRLAVLQPRDPLDVAAEKAFPKSAEQLDAEAEYAASRAQLAHFDVEVGRLRSDLGRLEDENGATLALSGTLDEADAPEWKRKLVVRVRAARQAYRSANEQREQVLDVLGERQLRANELERMRCARMADFRAEHQEEFARRASA